MESDGSKESCPLSVMCFDIEVYSPSGSMPKAEKDPIIMISYSFKTRERRGAGVITFKKIDLPFVESMPGREVDDKEVHGAPGRTAARHSHRDTTPAGSTSSTS